MALPLRGLSILTATSVGDGGIKFATPISSPPFESFGKELMVVPGQPFVGTGFDNANFIFFRLLLDAICMWVGGFLPILTNGFVMPVALDHAPNSIVPNLHCALQFDKLLHPLPIALIIVLSWLVERLCLFLGKSFLRYTFDLASSAIGLVRHFIHCPSYILMTIGHQAHIAMRDGGSRAMIVRHQGSATATLVHCTLAHPPESTLIDSILNFTKSCLPGAKMVRQVIGLTMKPSLAIAVLGLPLAPKTLVATASSSIKNNEMDETTTQVASYATPPGMLQLVAPTCFLPALPPSTVALKMATTNGLDVRQAKLERIVMWHLFPLRGTWKVLHHFTAPIYLPEVKPLAQIKGAPSQGATPVSVVPPKAELLEPSPIDTVESIPKANIQAFQTGNDFYHDEVAELDDRSSSEARLLKTIRL